MSTTNQEPTTNIAEAQRIITALLGELPEEAREATADRLAAIARNIGLGDMWRGAFEAVDLTPGGLSKVATVAGAFAGCITKIESLIPVSAERAYLVAELDEVSRLALHVVANNPDNRTAPPAAAPAAEVQPRGR